MPRARHSAPARPRNSKRGSCCRLSWPCAQRVRVLKRAWTERAAVPMRKVGMKTRSFADSCSKAVLRLQATLAGGEKKLSDGLALFQLSRRSGRGLHTSALAHARRRPARLGTMQGVQQRLVGAAMGSPCPNHAARRGTPSSRNAPASMLCPEGIECLQAGCS